MSKQDLHNRVQAHKQAQALKQALEQEQQSYARVRAEGVAAATRAIASAYPDEVAATLYERAYARARSLHWQRAPLTEPGAPGVSLPPGYASYADLQKERLAAARRIEREFPEMGAYDAPTRGAIIELALAYALNFDVEGAP